ncbi:MAG: OFA family MFS transporter [Chloroflexota bacterium]|nr:OFA family MFS transporter [Chloroflexota bacterium]
MSSPVTSSSSSPNRWVIAISAILVQLSLGAVYAWSVFLPAVMKLYGVSKPAANLTFSIVLAALGITAAFGGYFQNRFGPRVVASVGGILYGIGFILAGFAPNLLTLYLTYGVLAGIGIGLGYIVPLAMLIKWFPDRRGFITGLAVAGFGLGALITTIIATPLVQPKSLGVSQTFIYLGAAYLVIVVIASQFFRRAPDGYAPPGWTPTAALQTTRTARRYTLAEALRTPKWYVLWLILALNVTAGAALISVASPLARELTGVTAVTASIIVSVIAIFNGAGRLFWGWVSDTLGRPYTFLSLFIIQVIAFALMPLIGNFGLLLVPAAVIALCYGGGFGTMPAFAADFFGPKNSGTIYGAMLTAWSAGGIVGPILIASINTKVALYIIAGITLVSTILPLVAHMFARRVATETEVETTPVAG